MNSYIAVTRVLAQEITIFWVVNFKNYNLPRNSFFIVLPRSKYYIYIYIYITSFCPCVFDDYGKVSDKQTDRQAELLSH